MHTASGCASGLNHPRNMGFHLALIDKLAPVRLPQTLVHGGAKTRVSFQ